jgi:hypothetical protein
MYVQNGEKKDPSCHHKLKAELKAEKTKKMQSIRTIQQIKIIMIALRGSCLSHPVLLLFSAACFSPTRPNKLD